MSDKPESFLGAKPDLSDVKEWLSEAKSGSASALGKLLSALERAGPAALAIEELRSPPQLAFRFGITGPPGAGKSTLINELLKGFRSRFKKIGVLAVDPTSPFSQGAILGDRIRYSEHVLDPGVFIRSLGTRGSLGGLSSAAYLHLRAFDACGFDLVLIETVGVGQAETEVIHVADMVAVVLVPESGDSIQAMKAGVIEIADIFVINKSDRPGAEALAREIEAAAELSDTSEEGRHSGVRPQVVMTSALRREGIDELAAAVLKFQNSVDTRKRRNSSKRLQEEAKALLRGDYEQKMQALVSGISTPEELSRLFQK